MAGVSPIEWLRGRILLGLGLSASSLLSLGCAPATGDEREDEAGLTTDPSGGSVDAEAGTESGDGSGDGPATSTSTSTTTTTTTSSTGPDPDSGSTSQPGETDDSGPKFDLEPIPDVSDCNVSHFPSPATELDPECPLVPDDGFCVSQLYLGCVEPEPGQSCERVCPEGDCVDVWWSCNGDPIYDAPTGVCGPYEIDGMCCTLALIPDFCGTDGRPFVVDGRARTATLEGRGPAAGSGPASPVRERAAESWARAALAEHASVASFARFAAQLQAVGAPAELVREAIAAAHDELRHAAFARSRATQLAARELDFGALDTRPGADAPHTLAAMVQACIDEGCVGETIAALELASVAARCPSPTLAAELQRIAEDEARHAGLAWRFVAWAIEREPKLRREVEGRFAQLAFMARRCAEPPAPEIEAEALLREGCLSEGQRRGLARRALAELIEPCAAALLA